MRIQLLTETARIPKRMSWGAAAYDLFADEPMRMNPNDRRLIRTGVALEIPHGWEAQIRPRSGMALAAGVTVLNAPGTIDSDYRGEIAVMLVNLGDRGVEIELGDRIAQMVFTPVRRPSFCVVDELDPTTRGTQGFGSTGAR